MAAHVYSITLHHLAPGAKAAGLIYPDEHLTAVSATQLAELLYALSEVAARLTIYEPASPEIQIKSEREIFVVRPRYHRLCFVGWESILRGEEHSVAYILNAITGSTEHVKAAPKIVRTFASFSSAPWMETGGVPRWMKIAVMTVLIIGFNATAVWLLLRPSPTLAPKFTVLPELESRALLAKVAGEYQTGTQEGDRRLIIDPDGTLHLAKFGPQKSLIEEGTRTARGALAEGRAALVTNDPYVLAIKDADAVVLYGSTYRRQIH